MHIHKINKPLIWSKVALPFMHSGVLDADKQKTPLKHYFYHYIIPTVYISALISMTVQGNYLTKTACLTLTKTIIILF